MRTIWTATAAGLLAVFAGCTWSGWNAISPRGAAADSLSAIQPAAPTVNMEAQPAADVAITQAHESTSANVTNSALSAGEIVPAAVTLQAPNNSAVADPPAISQPASEVMPQVDTAVLPIEMGAALELAAGQNPQVAFAQQRIREASAQLRQADALWLPSLRAGINYNKHEGRMQDVEGVVQEISRGSLYTGFGAQAVGAGSPAVPGLLVNFHTRDALFQPRIAERTLAARQQASQAVLQDILTDTAIAYINLLEAVQFRAIAEETTVNLQDLADLTASFATSGAGLRSDADRVRTELLLQQVENSRADENVKVAAARLTQLLGQDPTLQLAPQEAALTPLQLVTPGQPLAELVATGLTNRPELAENQFLVAAAAERLRRERYAPLLPSLLLGVSQGWNGGGVGGNMENFGDRFDGDAVAWWEIRNLGIGEQAAREVARSQVAQARMQQIRVMDQVASEVAQGYAQLTSRQVQLNLGQEGILSANDSFRRNAERIRNAQGLPIESLQSVQALGQTQRQYARVVADYNRAQFLLIRALGWPVGCVVAP